jgi:hypothetical protein
VVEIVGFAAVRVLQRGSLSRVSTRKGRENFEGAGDGAGSWAVDGVRQIKWREGDWEPYGCMQMGCWVT